MTEPRTPLTAASRRILEDGLTGIHKKDVALLRAAEAEAVAAERARLRAAVEEHVERTGGWSDRPEEWLMPLLADAQPSAGEG